MIIFIEKILFDVGLTGNSHLNLADRTLLEFNIEQKIPSSGTQPIFTSHDRYILLVGFEFI